MSWELVGQGGVLDAYDVLGYEQTVEEETKVMLQVDLRYSLPSIIVNEIRSQLEVQDIPDLKVTQDSPLRIEWRKGAVFSLIVIGIILTLLLGILVIGWKFFKEVVEAIGGGAVLTALIVGGIILVGVVAYRKFKPRKKIK